MTRVVFTCPYRLAERRPVWVVHRVRAAGRKGGRLRWLVVLAAGLACAGCSLGGVWL